MRLRLRVGKVAHLRLGDITCIYAALFWEGKHKHSQEYGLRAGRIL